MANRGQTDMTGILAAWNDGEVGAFAQLMQVVDPALRQIVRQHLRVTEATTASSPPPWPTRRISSS